MRVRPLLPATVAALAVLAAGCGGTAGGSSPTVNSSVAPGSVDFSRPEPVLQAVFDAARSGDTSQLAKLCDPNGKNDGDTKKLCRVTGGGHEFESFKSDFAKGSIINTELGDGKAEVYFSYGPDGTKDGVMNLIQRKGKWYLFSL